MSIRPVATTMPVNHAETSLGYQVNTVCSGEIKGAVAMSVGEGLVGSVALSVGER